MFDDDIIEEAVRSQNVGQLNDLLYEAAKAVIACWDGGDLAAAVRELQHAVDGLDRVYEANLSLGCD